MADYFETPDELKIGANEILLGDKTIMRCGKEIKGLLANDLTVKLDDGTTVALITWIINRCSGNCAGATPTQQQFVLATFE